MPERVKVYYTPKGGGKVEEVEMWGVDAADAVKNHPEEYSYKDPKVAKAVADEAEKKRRADAKEADEAEKARLKRIADEEAAAKASKK